MIKDLLSKKFIKFSIGGLINYGLKIFITLLLTEVLNFWYFHSYIISLIVVIIFGFYYNIFITFKVKENKGVNFIKYLFALLIFITLDALLVKFTTEVIGFHYLISIIIITTLIFFSKYFVFGKFIFTKKTV